MPTRRRRWRDVWILWWLHADAQRSKGLLATRYQQLLDGFARLEQQQMCDSLAHLGRKGLIVVSRTPGGKPAYLLLTDAGYQWVSRVPRHVYM